MWSPPCTAFGHFYVINTAKGQDHSESRKEGEVFIRLAGKGMAEQDFRGRNAVGEHPVSSQALPIWFESLTKNFVQVRLDQCAFGLKSKSGPPLTLYNAFFINIVRHCAEMSLF